MRCISKQKSVIPQYLYYRSDWCEHAVCGRALEFLGRHDILKLSAREIELIGKKRLLLFAREQKKINRMFDLLKCREWERLVSDPTSPLAGHENLVLPECYLTVEQIRRLKDFSLMQTVGELQAVLLRHLKTCSSCFYEGKECDFCNDEHRLVLEYDVDSVGVCPRCKLSGHVECARLNQHDCL